jgi:hypothetical protein
MTNESKALELARELSMQAPKGILTETHAAAELRRQNAEIESLRAQLAARVPEIDYEALIAAAHKRDRKWAQGTSGCVAFKCGAEWFRDVALSAAPSQQAPAAQGEPVGKLCVFNDGGGDFGWSYDISTNYEGRKRLRDLDGALLYTHPQQASEPMTDEQIRARCKHDWTFETVRQWVRITEQFHNIKGKQ